MTARDLIEALRDEPIPEGWDHASGGAYTRELWAPDAETANRINRALTITENPRKGDDKPSAAELSVALDELRLEPSNIVIERAYRRRAEKALAEKQP